MQTLQIQLFVLFMEFHQLITYENINLYYLIYRQTQYLITKIQIFIILQLQKYHINCFKLCLHSDSTVIDKGIPNIYYDATQGQYNILVMDLLGPSLGQLFNLTLGKFSLKTVLMIIDQMITNVQYIHNRSFLHRDIQPNNFCIGMNDKQNKIFILDLGSAKRYINKDGKHIEYKEGKNIIGNTYFFSINSELGIQKSRRDDMESIGYIALNFLLGKLPWKGLKGGWAEKRQVKSNISTEINSKNLPEQFDKYLTQVKNLGFEERPDYNGYRSMFKDLFERNSYKFDYQYDWVTLKENIET